MKTKDSQALQHAIQLHQNGFDVEAEVIVRKILRAQANNVHALSMLGNLLFQRGDLEGALIMFGRAAAFRPMAGLYSNVGAVLKAMGRLEEAIDAYKKALKLDAKFSEAHSQLGFIYQNLGRVEEATVNFEHAVAIIPGSANAHLNLGSILQKKGKLEEASIAYKQAISIMPNFSKAHDNLGQILRLQGNSKAAVDHFRKAVEFDNKNANFYIHLATELMEIGDLKEGEELFLSAIKLNPDDALTNYSIGTSLRQQNKFREAVPYLTRAVELSPGFIEARLNLAFILEKLGQYENAISQLDTVFSTRPQHGLAHSYMASVLKCLGLVDESIAHNSKALECDSATDSDFTNLLLNLNYASNYKAEQIYIEHLKFGNKYENSDLLKKKNNTKISDRRIKIGYVSGDFNSHAVSYFIDAVLSRHDHSQFEIHAYSNTPKQDHVTSKLKAYCDHWNEISKLDDDKAAALILKDEIDILVDLSGHTANNRLQVFARKPAPIQVTWLGYPNTTGMKAMDYRITDIYAEPEGLTDHLNVERLYRLPDVFCCYTPCINDVDRRTSPELSIRPTPALDNGFVTFGCLNNFAKITPPVIDVWSQLLKEVPASKLLIEAAGLDSPFMQSSVSERFKAHGIEPARLILMGRKSDQQYVLYQKIDIALDPFPCTGGTTSFDALWMGVPLVTLAGNTFVSRMGVSLLSNLGLQELIGTTYPNYIEIAKNLASDLSRLNSLRLDLRRKFESSPLMDGDKFTHNLEVAFRKMWKTWCEQDSAAIFNGSPVIP